MAGQYAEGTTVSPEKTQMEISALLRKYGATGYQFGWEGAHTAILFKAHGRSIRFLVEMPSPDDRRFRWTPSGQERKQAAVAAAHEAEVRRRWRCLFIAIKAKLEAVETGIASFEDEFLAYTVLPDNTTVGEHLQQQVIDAWAAGGQAPRLIGGAR